MLRAIDRRKAAIFGVVGAVGCLAGGIVGEGFLRIARPVDEQAQRSASLIARPEPIPLPSANPPAPPAPLLSLGASKGVPPAPPLLPSTPIRQIAPPAPAPPALPSLVAAPPPPEFAERLRKFGAATGDIQITLLWNNRNDLDLVCIEPSGQAIHFDERRSPSGGWLDVDKNAYDVPAVRDPVENIAWASGLAPAGQYRVYVAHWDSAARRDRDPTRFRLNVLVDGERREIAGSISYANTATTRANIVNSPDKKLIHQFTVPPSLMLAIPDKVVLHPGTANRLPVKIGGHRSPGSIRLHCEGELQGLRVTEAAVSEGQNETAIELQADPAATAGSRELKVVGQSGSITAEESFVVQVLAPPPVLRLAVLPETIVHRNGENAIRVRVVREGVQAAVRLHCEGDLRGLNVPAVQLEQGGEEATLLLQAEAAAELGPRQVRVMAQADTLTAEAPLRISVAPTPPVLRAAVSPHVVVNPGTSNKAMVSVVCEGIGGPVGLRCEGDLRGITIADSILEEGKRDASLRVDADARAEPGRREVRLVAQAGDTTTEASFTVAVEAPSPVLRLSVPAEVTIRRNSSNRVPVRIVRQWSDDPVALRLKDDVTGLTLSPLELEDGQDEGEMLLTAADSAEAGRRTVAVLATCGNLETKGRFDVVIPEDPKLAFSWRQVLATGIWTGLLTIGLALALATGQRLYLSGRWPRWSLALALTVGGMLVGLMAGGFGQSLYSLLAKANVLPQLGLVVGWGLLGALVGRGIGFFIPNLHGGKAALAGAVGGLLGATAFLAVSTFGNMSGRCVGAAILGCCIGLVVALVEGAFRDAWLEVVYGSREMRTVNLGAEPVALGSASSCTIWTPTAEPVALKFWISQGQVTRQDINGNQTGSVADGHREKVGSVEIVVRTGKLKHPASIPIPPPPPPKKKAPAVSPAPPAPAVPTGSRPAATIKPPPPPRRKR